MRIERQLYRPYDPGQKHPFVFKKDYAHGSGRIFLRPFFIPDDLGFYNQWINDKLNNGQPQTKPSLFSQSYFEAVLESSNAQSLWGMIDGVPSFELELYNASGYAFPAMGNFPFEQGDVVMQLVIAPGAIMPGGPGDLIMPACLDYLSLHQGVGRVLLLSGRQGAGFTRLIREAGPTRRWQMRKGCQVYEYQVNIRI